MKTMRYVLFGCLTLFFMSCSVRSLLPLFGEKNLVFNLGLIGAWKDMDKKEIYYIQKSEGKNYTMIVCNEKGDTSKHIAQLGQLGKFWFLDSYPISCAQDYQMIPIHIISKIRLNGDTLSFGSFESDHLKNLIQSGNVKIPHVILDDKVVLTASSDEMQQLVLLLAEDENAFPQPTRLIRIK